MIITSSQNLYCFEENKVFFCDVLKATTCTTSESGLPSGGVKVHLSGFKCVLYFFYF